MAYSVSHDVLLFAGVVVLATCIFFDIGMAYKRGAKWIPGYAVVIYALCLQLVGYLDVQNVNIRSTHRDDQLELLISNQLSIDSSRLVLFVFVAYLMPNLASTYEFWTNIVGLFASLSIHIAIELSVTLQSRVTENAKVVQGQSGIWVIVSGFVMLDSFYYYLAFIGWAIGLGRFIRDNLSSRISLALESPEINNETNFCQSEMLKAWIVARVSQPEYVLIRSPFSLLLLFLVTFNVEFIGVKAIFLRSQLLRPFPLFTIQLIFSILGWFVVSLRCFIGLDNYTELEDSLADCSWLTRYSSTIHVLMKKVKIKIVSLFLKRKENFIHPFQRLQEHFIDPFQRLHEHFIDPLQRLPVLAKCLLITPFWLLAMMCLAVSLLILLLVMFLAVSLPMVILALVMFLAVFLPMAILAVVIYLVSLPVVIYVGFIAGSMSEVLFSSESPVDEENCRYREALKRVCMPGEKEQSLWVANKSSFDHIKHCIEGAHGKGKRCKKWQKVIGSRLAQNTPPSEDLKELLEPLESVKIYFPLLKDSFRRITAFYLLRMVSLINDFISEDQHSLRELNEDVRTAFKEAEKPEELIDVRTAFTEAEDLMDFLDCPDNVGISLDIFKISNLEAFILREASVSDFSSVRLNFRESSTVANAVEKLCNEAEKELRSSKLLEDISSRAINTNWSKAAEAYAMYKVCKIILDRRPTDNLAQLQNYLINMVVDLIAMCVRESPRILVERSRKWAAEFREDKITAAIELAGFACGVIDGVNEPSPSTREDSGG